MGALKSKFRRSKSGSRKGENGEKPSGSKKKKKNVNLPESQSARKIVDPRLPFGNYRQIFSIRNAWKAIQRSLDECAMETMLKFLNTHPDYKEKFSSIKDLNTEEELRNSTEFEEMTMEMYGIFDGVIGNLEAVDKALMEIEMSTPATKFTHKMLQDYKEPFIEVIRQTLGSDRFTETTEDNYKLLYQFVQEEMDKLIEDDEPDTVADHLESDAVVDTQVEVNLHTETDVVADTHVEVNLCTETDMVADTQGEVNLCTETDMVADTQGEVNLCTETDATTFCTETDAT